MKRLIVLSILLGGCQKPAAQAPVYNYTFTDNSQFIVGDSNAVQSIPTTKNTQKSESSASAESKKIASHWWIFALLIGAAACGAGYYAWRRGILKF